MSEGPLPENMADAARWLLGTVFIFVAGFEGYVMLWDGRILSGIISVLLAVFLTGVLVKWRQIATWAGPRFSETANSLASDARIWVGAIMLTLFVISVSPFIEQRRWPFTVHVPIPTEGISELRWPALTSSEASALASRLRFVPPADIVVACETPNCRDLADGIAAILQKTPGWKVSILHHGGLDITGVTGIRVNPNEPATQALKEAIEATTSLKVEVGPDTRKDVGNAKTFFVVGNRPF